jgi:hypothetical protein
MTTARKTYPGGPAARESLPAGQGGLVHCSVATVDGKHPGLSGIPPLRGIAEPFESFWNRILAQSKRRTLSKRSDCVLVLIVDIEQRQEAAHAQGLRNDLWQVRQLYVSSGTFAGLKNFDEEAYAAGVEPIDAGKIEDELCLSVSNEIVQGLS